MSSDPPGSKNGRFIPYNYHVNAEDWADELFFRELELENPDLVDLPFYNALRTTHREKSDQAERLPRIDVAYALNFTGRKKNEPIELKRRRNSYMEIIGTYEEPAPPEECPPPEPPAPEIHPVHAIVREPPVAETRKTQAVKPVFYLSYPALERRPVIGKNMQIMASENWDRHVAEFQTLLAPGEGRWTRLMKRFRRREKHA